MTGAGAVPRQTSAPVVIEKLLPLISESLTMKLAERGYDVGNAIPPDMVAALRAQWPDLRIPLPRQGER